MTINIKENNQPWMIYTFLCEAAKTLNGAAFKLYVYFTWYCEGQTIKFSYGKYVESFGGGLTSARRAFQELLEHKYLVGNDDNYNFYYTPSQNGI